MARKKKTDKRSQELDFTHNNPKDETSRRSLGSYYIKKNSSILRLFDGTSTAEGCRHVGHFYQLQPC